MKIVYYVCLNLNMAGIVRQFLAGCNVRSANSSILQFLTLDRLGDHIMHI
jgi:hypothetical protein